MKKFISNNTGIDNFVKNNSDATVAKFGHLNAIVDVLNKIGSNYKIYTAVLSQKGEDDPEAQVIFNSLGVDITWTRSSTGIYQGNPSSDIFTENNVFPSVAVNGSNIELGIFVDIGYKNSVNYIVFRSYNLTDGFVDFDGKVYIEIKVYNN